MRYGLNRPLRSRTSAAMRPLLSLPCSSMANFLGFVLMTATPPFAIAGRPSFFTFLSLAELSIFQPCLSPTVFSVLW